MSEDNDTLQRGVNRPERVSRRTFVGRAGATALAVGGIGSYLGAERAYGFRKAKGEVRVITWWFGSKAKNLGDAFKEETGLDLVAIPGGGDADFYTKVRTSKNQYDVVVCNGGYALTYAKNKLIEPLDLRQFPAHEQVYPQYLTDRRFVYLTKPFHGWGFPHEWGVYAFMYSLIDKWHPAMPISWNELWNVPNGKVMLDGNPDTNVALGLRLAGVPWNKVYSTGKGAALDKTIEKLRELKPFQLAMSQPQVNGGFIHKTIDIDIDGSGLGGSNTVNQQAGKTIVKSVIPKEGTLGSVGTICLINGAHNRANALKWINFMGGDKAQTILWDMYSAPTANRVTTNAVLRRGGAQRKLMVGIKGNRPDVAAKLTFTRFPSDANAWNTAWDKVLA